MAVAGKAGAPELAALDTRAAELGIDLLHDSQLAPYTTLRVGGPADRLATPRNRAQLLATLRLAHEVGVPIFVMGNGSDLVVADAGIRGLVIRNRANAATMHGVELRGDSGAPLAMLVRRCTAAGLAGFEFGIAIPGSLGGAVWANAGAHGGEMAGIVTSVEVWDPLIGDTREIPGAECRFAYRESRFKHTGEIIIGATLALRPDDAADVEARVAAHQARRLATQPLADQNAGSVFRNPPGDHAGRLIDAAGLKGTKIGGASVSHLHANFIITERGASAADVRGLGDLVRAAVADRFGVTLEYEIEFVGDWPAAAGADS